MWSKIARELLSGLTVAIVALPLAIAFGITATGTGEGALVGLYGAIFAGFFAAIFGGTPAQVTGPTGPITVVATATIAAHGLESAFIVFMVAGAMQIVFGICKLGSYVRYIPYPVVSGFMGGIALIIILGELDQVSTSFLLVLITVVLMLASGRWITKVPASLVVLVAITAALPLVDAVLGDIRVDYIGRIPSAIPSIHLPALEGSSLLGLLLPALAIALLGSIDSLLTSVVMDNMTGTRHRSNRELIGQGIGNIVSGLFGGLASAGATVRSVVNLRGGGSTAISAAAHSVILLAFVVGLSGAVQYIPLAVLSGILILTAIGMFDWESLRKVHVTPRGDVAVMIATMVVTVMVDLTVAVAVGMVMSLVIHAFASRKRTARVVQDDEGTYQVHGPLSFLSADGVVAAMREVEDDLVLSLKHVDYIDSSGAKALLHFVEHSARTGIGITLRPMPDHIERRLVALANDEQRGHLNTPAT